MKNTIYLLQNIVAWLILQILLMDNANGKRSIFNQNQLNKFLDSSNNKITFTSSICIDNILKKCRQQTKQSSMLSTSTKKNFMKTDKTYFCKQTDHYKVKSSNTIGENLKKSLIVKPENKIKRSLLCSFYPRFQPSTRLSDQNQLKHYEHFRQKLFQEDFKVQVKKVQPLKKQRPQRLQSKKKQFLIIEQKRVQTYQKKISIQTQKQSIEVQRKSPKIQQNRSVPSTVQEKVRHMRYSFLKKMKQQTKSVIQLKPRRKISNQNRSNLVSNLVTQKLKSSEFDKRYLSALLQKHIDLDENTIQFFQDQQIIIQQHPTLKILPTKFTSKSINVMYATEDSLIQLFQKYSKNRVQIASLTKTMTCLLALKIAEKFNINIKQQKLVTSQKASRVCGTSAKLQYSDTGTLYEFLHGLMLPSGNDAAIAISQWGGKVIRKHCSLVEKIKNKDKVQKFYNQPQKISFIKLFIYHMNKSCEPLGLSDTFYGNVHGLMNSKSHSTSFDTNKLAYIAMKHSIFRQIVSKKQFQCKLYNRTYSNYRIVKWQNTNKLLTIEGFKGTKTGITPTAGPCLSSLYQVNKTQSILITVLKANSTQMRFKDTIQILKEILKKLNYKSMHKIIQKMDKFTLKERQDQNLGDQEDQ